MSHQHRVKATDVGETARAGAGRQGKRITDTFRVPAEEDEGASQGDGAAARGWETAGGKVSPKGASACGLLGEQARQQSGPCVLEDGATAELDKTIAIG